jgi:RNA polymerase sigma-70 factor (ECF subfamily)
MDASAALERSAASRDALLIREAAGGRASAFEALVRSRLDRCYRLAYAILGNADDARDATQDGVVAAWRELPRLRDPNAFDPWLNRVVANAARMRRRRRIRLREVRVDELSGPDDRDAAAGVAPQPDRIDAIADADAIGRAFKRLREADRVVLVMHHVEERPVAEIAATLSMRVGTVKWRLHRARAALEQALEAES